MTDPRTLPNDRFGYSVYSLVAQASPEQVRMVAEARVIIGQERAMVPAHVTIRGTFYGIESLEAMRGLLRETAAGLGPAQVEFSSDGWKFVTGEDGRHTCVMPCVTTPDLLSLHDSGSCQCSSSGELAPASGVTGG
jgi:hypothetical protein